MGYGILFAGYMFLLSIPLRSMGVCAELIGYVLMIRALFLLGQYQKHYRYAEYCVIAMVPFGIFSIVLQGIKMFGSEALYEQVLNTSSFPYGMIMAVLLLVFHWFLLSATQAIAKDVELPDIVRQAMRNRIVTILYFVLNLAGLFLNIPAVTEKVPYQVLTGLIFLFGCAWLLLNAKMIFNCYMWICLPGDEDMPMRDSKIPSIFRRETPKQETPEEAYQRQKDEYNEAMRQRQLERTKKNKRRRH